MSGVTYRGYHIYFGPPPIPIRTMDWHFVHEDYDGAPNNPGEGPADHRAGDAASEQACRDEIDMLEDDEMSDFAWLIEAPGARYLGTRDIGHYPEFYWTTDAAKATRFMSSIQADGVMMAVRRLAPELWAFAANLGEARPTEHGWLDDARADLADVEQKERT